MSVQRAILVVSHGTAETAARTATIDILEREIACEFPAWEVRRAFTSAHVRAKLAAREGLHTDSTAQALQKLSDEGCGEVLVQPTHIIPGEEYEQMLHQVQAFRRSGRFRILAAGRPLLGCEGDSSGQPDDYRIAVGALRTQLPASCGPVILMGHGTGHAADRCYDLLQKRLDAVSLPVYAATLSGSRTFEAAMAWLAEIGARQATLMPFMLTAGGHALNDMAGPEEGSWRQRLRAENFEVSLYLRGLGENPAFRRIYLERLRFFLSAQSLPASNQHPC